MRIFVSLVLLASLAVADDSAAEKAISFNEESFKKEVSDFPFLVKFYAPWCGHCKRLAPVWEELAGKYNDNADTDVKIGKVDCTIETALCSAQDVTGYPTLKFFKSGVESGVKYRGQRDLDSLANFVEEQMGRGVKKEEKEEASEPEVPVVDNGLYILTQKSFKKHIETGEHFIKFYAPWCGHCQKLAPTWDELAKAFEKDDKVKIAKLDCTTAQSVCQDFDVRGYPTLAYFRNGEKVENYRGARNIGELKDFVTSMKEAGSGKAKAEKAEEEKVESAVVKVDKDNFKDTIKEGVSFIKFFAPWCGHCKRLAPTWEKFAQHYAGNDNIRIGHVDCTSDDNKNKELCNEQGVNGFPTLILYSKGEKVAEYNDKRDLEDLKAFVDKHAGADGDQAKDEL